MEQDILLACVAAPAIISLAFVLLATIARRIADGQRRERTIAVMASLGWCVAVTATLLLRQQIDCSAPEAWQLVIVPIAVTSLLLALGATSSVVTSSATIGQFRWVVAGLGCIVTAMVAMPSGEGWTDQLPHHRVWMAAIAGSALLNLWMLEQLARRGAASWVLLVALAGLAGPTILAAGTYAGLAEWLLGAIVATGILAIAAMIWRDSMIWHALTAIVLFAATATAAGRFYTYEDHPSWLYALILLSPTCVALPDVWFKDRSTFLRVMIAGSVAIVVIALIGWVLLGDSLLGGAAEEEW